MSEDIIIAIISAGVPSAATIVSAFFQNRLSKKHAARNSILQLIMEDHMSVQEGGIPTNYQSVLLEYDNYVKAGGNSYISQKIQEYKDWFAEQEKRLKS